MSRKRSLDQFFRELRFWDVSLIYKIRAFVIFFCRKQNNITFEKTYENAFMSQAQGKSLHLLLRYPFPNFYVPLSVFMFYQNLQHSCVHSPSAADEFHCSICCRFEDMMILWFHIFMHTCMRTHRSIVRYQFFRHGRLRRLLNQVKIPYRSF